MLKQIKQRISIARLPYLLAQECVSPKIVDSNRELVMEHLIQSCLKHSLLPSQSLVPQFRKKLEKYNHIGLIYKCYYHYPSLVSSSSSSSSGCSESMSEQSSERREKRELMCLKFITNYFFFLFSVDDRIDGATCSDGGDEQKERNNLIDELILVLNAYRQVQEGGRGCQLEYSKGGDPHVKFMIQIMEELHSITQNQETIDRFVRSMEDFYNIGVRNCPKDETPEQYLERRIYDSATYAMLNVVEITSSRNGVGLIGKDYNPELFSKVHKLCAIVFSLVNDLLSYHKDVVLPSGGNLLGGDVNLSYIQVLLKNNKDLSLEQATNQCIDYIIESKAQFEDIMKQCTEKCNEKQLEYLRGVEKLMDGMCVWMLYSNRYRHEEQVYDELTQLINEEKF